ncbi:peptide chain release factor family protein [Thalassoroseus pseudoceratinae]|uniref:peptide chain release factor family protein n=1 Tax=Thalassoroseus pseudoceratinae TaxID=2713176 RepID=UPI0014244DF4|nr:peptide chain release factor-like protein [Thalassoroseus pseudoceratinae]
MFRHPTEIPPDQLQSECDVKRLKRGGPGGQHRNKVETAVVLHHRPTGVSAEANERRSQSQNLQAALFRLRIALALQVRREWNTPSELWTTRVRSKKIQVRNTHDDFPALLAEALDAFEAGEWNAAEVADSLETTTSQLVKFLKLEPDAFGLLNQKRVASGLKPLK